MLYFVTQSEQSSGRHACEVMSVFWFLIVCEVAHSRFPSGEIRDNTVLMQQQ